MSNRSAIFAHFVNESTKLETRRYDLHTSDGRNALIRFLGHAQRTGMDVVISGLSQHHGVDFLNGQPRQIETV